MSTANTKITKTKQKLVAGLITASKEKSIKKLTVGHLCQLAHVNRSTFYLHYKDIDDFIDELKAQTLETLLQEVKKELALPNRKKSSQEEPSAIDYSFIVNALQATKQKKKLIQCLLGNHGDPQFHHEVKKELRFVVSGSLLSLVTDSDLLKKVVPSDYLEIIFFDTIVNILLHWLEKGMSEPPEVIATIIKASVECTFHFTNSTVTFNEYEIKK